MERILGKPKKYANKLSWADLYTMACNKWGQSKILVIVVGGRVWGNFTLTPDITQQIW